MHLGEPAFSIPKKPLGPGTTEKAGSFLCNACYELNLLQPMYAGVDREKVHSKHTIAVAMVS